jgi:SpoVK/Ycf46/Vps4 family AAA+-type ATPase
MKMKFNTYQKASKGMKEEHLEIMDNILLPVLTGQSVIHVRTHEEDRVVGICESIHSRISEDFRVLHILSDAGVESDMLSASQDEEEEAKFTALSTQTPSSANDVHTSLHVRALNSFLSTNEGGILLILGADTACKQSELIRRLKTHANDGLYAPTDEELKSPKLVVLHTISQDTPETLSRTIQNYDLPLPRDGTLSGALRGVCNDMDITEIGDDKTRKDWVLALRGLTVIEAERSLQQTFTVHDSKMNVGSLAYLQAVKRNIIKQTGIMEFHEPTTSFSDIGGLANLVEDLSLRQGEFEIQARDAGIQSPKGCLLVGLPGTGKSLIAQSVAGEWSMPMLEFNMANVLDSYVGGSEANMKKILAVAESMAPCVLMVDEIDKALSGLGSAGGDSGVTRRVIGNFLTWLNDRKADVYVIATANDLSEIAGAMPEMLRKGRWDDIWWVDLPDQKTRQQILEIHLHKIPSARIEKEVWGMVTAASELNPGITGAELAAAVNEANRISFHRGELLSAKQLTSSIEEIKPLASGIRGLEKTRKWMKDFARAASPEEAAKVSKTSDVYLAAFDASQQFKTSESDQ